jgi:hypothetical protein
VHPEKRAQNLEAVTGGEMLSMIEEIIRDLLIFVAVMFALSIVLLVVVSKMPDENPLKRIMTALSYRVGATLAAGVVAIPIEPLPGLDVLYDIVVLILLIWYWFTFFRDATRSSATSGTSHTVTPLPRRPVHPETDRKLPKTTTFENL